MIKVTRMGVARMAMAVAGVTLLAGAAIAKDGGINAAADGKAATVSAQAAGVEQAALAANLAAYGRSSGNAYALLLAGQLQSGIGAVGQARSKVSEGTEAAGGAAKAGHAELTPATLFAEARALAGTDRDLVARIDRAADRQTKGRTGGPTRHVDQVRAGMTDVYTIQFRGGEVARVAATGDGDTDLDLYIYDENGNEVCSDTDTTDRTICSWTPAWTGSFTVKIKNLGNVYNQYTLITN